MTVICCTILQLGCVEALCILHHQAKRMSVHFGDKRQYRLPALHCMDYRTQQSYHASIGIYGTVHRALALRHELGSSWIALAVHQCIHIYHDIPFNLA